MSKKNNLSSILQNILTFAIIFLAVNMLYNYFFAPNPSSTATGITLKLSSSSYDLNSIPEVSITNNQSSELVIPSACPNAPLAIYFQQDNQWQKREITKNTIPCPQQEIKIAPQQTQKITFGPWLGAFQELGQYKLTLANGAETLETTTFEVKTPGFIAWLWTLLLHQPIYNVLVFLGTYLPFHDLGLAIILLTILFRTLLLFPNHKALKSQRKLQSIQPKMEEIKQKHAGNQEKIAMETLALYKEQKVNPFGSCLPILIQLPILIALYNVVQHGISPLNSHLLYPFLQNIDTSIINTNFLGFLDLTKVEWTYLPILVGGLQFIQTQLAMGKNKKTAKKELNEMEIATRTMTYTMPVMIAVFTASVPAGVGLYWCFNTIYGIAQQLIVNKQVMEKDTTIRLAKEDHRTNKKEEYRQKHAERLAQKNETSVIESEPAIVTDKPEDDNSIIKIKA